MISILILTKNEERDLPDCLASAAWCDDVHVLDSGSTDGTCEIARRSGAQVAVRTYPDTSKIFAFNFFVPNINANFFLSGNAQASLKSRAFLFKFNNDLLTVGQGNYNLTNADGNAYLVMFKMYSNLNGDVEIGSRVARPVLDNLGG